MEKLKLLHKNISKILACIVRGQNRFSCVPQSLKEMNNRVKDSHRNSPWHGNTHEWGPNSRYFWLWANTQEYLQENEEIEYDDSFVEAD